MNFQGSHDDIFERDRELVRVIDRLNEKHGRNAVRFGMPARKLVNWQMSRSFLSRAFTTDIRQVLKVRV